MATRPVTANGGLGMMPPAALAALEHFHNLFPLRPDPADLFDRWKTLVSARGTLGKAAHDARLVAAMQAHGIDRIVTFTVADFSRYPGVTALDPANLLGGPGAPP